MNFRFSNIFLKFSFLSILFLSTISAQADLTGLLIPFYGYPTAAAIQPIIAAKTNNPDLPIRVILDPASGTGIENDPTYVSAIAAFHAAGIQVAGYIYTDYNVRAESDIENVISNYHTDYGVDGIFFDAMGAKLTYYQTLTQYAKSLGISFVIGNPGENVDPSYASVVDTVVIDNGSDLPNLANYTNWEDAALPKSAVAMVLSDIETYPASLITGIQSFVGWFYATNLGGMGAWQSLPTYFSQLVAGLDTPTDGILFPFYIYPTATALQPAISAKQSYPNVPMRLILNPNSGPGTAQNPDYVNAVASLRAAGISVCGYVDTDYTNVPLATVESHIAQWVNWYKPDGIFLDQMALNHTYYQTLTSYAKGLGIKYVIGNAGTTIDVSAGNDVDTVVISENYVLPNLSSTGFQAWFAAYPPAKMALLSYEQAILPTAFVQQAVQNIGWVFFTNAGVNGSDPWASYPSYWLQEVQLLNNP